MSGFLVIIGGHRTAELDGFQVIGFKALEAGIGSKVTGPNSVRFAVGARSSVALPGSHGFVGSDNAAKISLFFATFTRARPLR
jgi:hypothetical protein